MDAFNKASDKEIQTDLHSLSTTCDLIGQATSVMTPKHLGLARFLHHEYGVVESQLTQ